MCSASDWRPLAVALAYGRHSPRTSSGARRPLTSPDGTRLNILEALFVGAKALVKGIASVARTVVREVLKEIDQSAFGRAATRLVDGIADRYFNQARDLADEQRDLAARLQRDGRRTDADAERLRQIEAELRRIRAELERANGERSAQELRDHADETLLTRLDDDELRSNVGILAAKVCTSCGGTMRIRQAPIASDTGLRRFYWQCTGHQLPPCPYVKLDPSKGDAGVVRLADPDLDTPKADRRAVWNRPDVLAETHRRVRQHLGNDDKQVVCPQHVLPMKLLPKRLQGGRVLDSYEYVCLEVTADGRACNHKIELQTMPQVAAMLRRTEGEGIIQG